MVVHSPFLLEYASKIQKFELRYNFFHLVSKIPKLFSLYHKKALPLKGSAFFISIIYFTYGQLRTYV